MKSKKKESRGGSQINFIKAFLREVVGLSIPKGKITRNGIIRKGIRKWNSLQRPSLKLSRKLTVVFLTIIFITSQ